MARHGGSKPQLLSAALVDQDGQKDHHGITPLASKGGNQAHPLGALQADKINVNEEENKTPLA